MDANLAAVLIALMAIVAPTLGLILSHQRALKKRQDEALAKLAAVHQLVDGNHTKLLEENAGLKAALAAILAEIRQTPHTGETRSPAVR